MKNEKKLIRSINHNNTVIFSVLKDDVILITLKKDDFKETDEFSEDLIAQKEEKELTNEVFGKLEKIYKISLNDSDFQSRGLKYIENKLHVGK